MKLVIPFTYECDTEVVYADLGIREWRWVVDIDLFRSRPSIDCYMEIRLHDGHGGWRHHKASGCAVSLNRIWKWDEDHQYYDGEHCFWSFGYLRFYRGGNHNCEKCHAR